MERSRLRQQDGVEAKRLWRAALFASTGLSAVLALPAPARAQIDPATTPQGGVVVGGSATITQAPGTTTIDQSSQRTAINWQSFNVGANAEVQFNQPNSSAIALNRVTGGDLSQIYGRIDANGQIILINQSGVVFAKGSQVNAESVVVSTANISDKAFMAGQLNFTGGSNPGAKIINDGKITAGQAGLVGLVAPQVSNSGVITAQLGQVVLAGATAFTLDLYGDRLISLDVTQAVRSIDLGGKAVPALVTNSGIIIANGGKITLTAQDADALVTQLINAGGTLRADTVGTQTGAISIQGVGGNIQIAGNLLARGTASGTAGGVIEASTTGTVAIGSTANIDASGASRGGIIAIGTNLARAAQGAADVSAPRAEAVSIASGATLKADATVKGNAGKVVLLSAKETDFQGAISVQGGPQGGNGGLAEISSDGVISLGGTVLATAIDGQPGEILLDPQTLVVTIGGTASGVTGGGTVTFGGTDTSATNSLVDPSELNSLSGTVILEASKLVSVASAINMTNASALSISSGGNVSISASITVDGSIAIDASNSLFVGAKLVADNGVLLQSGTAGTNIDGLVTVTGAGVITLASTGTISEDALNGTLEADTLLSAGSIGGDLLLTNTGNDIFDLGPLSAANISIYSNAILTATGSVSAGNIDLTGSAFNFNAPVTATKLLTLDATGNGLGHPGTIGQTGTGVISAATLAATAGGNISLASANTINNLGSVVGGGDFDLADTGSLKVIGNVTAQDVTIAVPTLSLDANINATLATDPVLALAMNAMEVTAGTVGAVGGTVDIAPFSTNTGIDFGTAANALDLIGAQLTALDGNAATIVIGNAPAGTEASFIHIDNNTSFASGTVVDLATAGTIQDNSATFIASTLAFDAAGFTQAAGAAIRAALLEGDGGTIGGDVLLNGTLNSIAGLGDISLTSGTFALTDKISLGLTGLLSAATVALTDNAGIGEGTGTISVGTLDVASIGGDVDFGTAAQTTIGNLGSIDLGVNHTLTVNETSPLGVGSLTAGTASLTAGGITFAGNANLTSLILASTGDVGQSGGSIAAGTLSFTDHGDTVLDSTSNQIGDVQGSSRDSISLGDGQNLTVTGGLTGSSVFLDIAGGKALTLGSAGTLDATGNGGTLSILADSLAIANATAGAIQANLGTIVVAPVTGSRAITVTDQIVGGTGLVLGPNFFTDAQGQEQVLQLGNSSLTGTIGLGLDPTDSENFGTATLDLISQGGATQKGDLTAGTLSFHTGTFAQALLSTIAVNELDGTTSHGDVNLADAANQIGAIGTLGATGDITLADNEAASLTGAISTSGTLTLDNGGGGYTEATGGVIDAGTLTTGLGSISGAAVFGNANSVSNIGNFAANSLTLNDPTSLTVAGTVSAGSITLTGTSLGEAATGAALNTGTLTTGSGSFSGGVTLNGAANSIASVDAFTLGNGSNLVLQDAEALTLSNVITTSGAVSLTATGGIAEASGGIIDAATFSGGSSGGDIFLLNSNGIGTLVSASVASGHTFVLVDPVSITVGNVTASTAGISAGNIDITGTIDASTLLALASTGSIVQGSTGVIEAGTLSTGGASVTGSASLTGANSIATLGSFVIDGNFDLNDKINLTIADALSAANINLAAPTLTVDAPVTAGTSGGLLGLVFNAVSLGGTGSFAAHDGTIAIAPFSASNGIDLAGSEANALDLSTAFLNGLDATATEILLGKAEGYTATNITIDNTASIAAPLLVLSTPGSIVDAGVLQANTLAFDSAGFTQGSTGALDVTLLEGDGNPITGNIDLPSTLNNIGTIGSIAAGTFDLALTDDAQLTVAGPVTARDITLIDADTNIFTGGIGIAGTLAAAGTGTLSLVANSLFGSTGSLTGGTVAISPYTSSEVIDLGGSNLFELDLSQALLDLVSPAAVLQIGTAAGFAGGVILTENSLSLASNNVLLSGAGMTFDGTIDAPGLLALVSSGAITQASTGAIDAATLTSGGTTIAGAAALIGINSITSLGTFAASGGIALNDTASLAISGLVSTPGELSLGDTGGIGESGGITAGTLDSGGTTIGGDVMLTGSNSITTLGGLTVASGHSLSLDDATALNVTGPLVAPTATISAAGISLTGNIDAATLLVLESSSGITQTGGTITTGDLTSGGTTIGGNVALASANAITDFGAFTVASGDSLSVADAGLLTVNGPVSASTVTLSGGTIALAGNIAAPTLLALKSTGNITQTAGSITTADLTSSGTIGGAVSLSAANAITGIGSFAAAGNILLGDATALAINGLLSTPGALSLEDSNGISESGGISAGTLTSGGTSIGGDVALTGSNSITTLGGFTVASGHSLSLDDATALNVTGSVIAPSATISAAGISLTGNIDAATLLVLESSAGITQAGGTITTGDLTSGGTTIGGNVTLASANAITDLGGFTVASGHTLNLSDAGLLTVTGPVAAPTAIISAGSLALAGNIGAATGLALESTGGVTQTSGIITTADLTSGGISIGGDVALTGGNSITGLGGFTVASGHGLTLDDATSLTVTGPVVAPTATISATSIALTGNIDAATELTLESSSGITQTGGTITTADLTSGGTTIGGAVSLTSANAITAIGDLATSGNFALNNTPSLSIAGTLASAGTVALEAAAGVTETTGIIDAADLTSLGTGITGNAVLNGANSITSLGNFNASGALALTDQTALGINGAVSLGGTLALLDTGSITQTGGSIIAAALTSDGGTIGGAVALTQSGNQIPDIGDFAASGGLAFTNNGTIDLTGNIFTGTNALDLITPDNITQNGGIITTGALNANAANISLGSANAITALGSVTTGELYVNGAAGLTGPVTATDATLKSTGAFTLAGPAAITNTLLINSGGNLVQTANTGPVTATEATFTSGGGITLSGTTAITDKLYLDAAGDIIHAAGSLSAGILTGTMTGAGNEQAQFGAYTDFATLGSFIMQDSTFALDNAGALTFIGPLVANVVSITVHGLLTLEGSGSGGLFITGKIEPSTATMPLPGDSVITVAQNNNVDNGNPRVVETGTFYIDSGPNAQLYLGNQNRDDTLFINTTPSGNITFDTNPAGLNAPFTNLVLSAGPRGVITGNVNLYRIVILNALSTDLTGTLDNVPGQAGAGKGVANPFPTPSFRFNACPIGSVNCTILPIESLPSTNPLQNFDIEQRKKKRLNHNIQLPGIATRDF